jgi:hypothetical protein
MMGEVVRQRACETRVADGGVDVLSHVRGHVLEMRMHPPVCKRPLLRCDVVVIPEP